MKTVGKVLAVLGAVLVAILLCRSSARRVPENRSALESRPIRLAVRTVDPAACANPPDPPAESLSSRGTCAYVVQSVGPVSAAVRDRVAWQGARLISYLPTDALLVEATPESVRALLKTKVFSAAFAYLPSDKQLYFSSDDFQEGFRVSGGGR